MESKESSSECAALCKAANACGQTCNFYRYCDGSCTIGDLTRNDVRLNNVLAVASGVGVGNANEFSCKIRVRNNDVDAPSPSLAPVTSVSKYILLFKVAAFSPTTFDISQKVITH